MIGDHTLGAVPGGAAPGHPGDEVRWGGQGGRPDPGPQGRGRGRRPLRRAAAADCVAEELQAGAIRPTPCVDVGDLARTVASAGHHDMQAATTSSLPSAITRVVRRPTSRSRLIHPGDVGLVTGGRWTPTPVGHHRRAPPLGGAGRAAEAALPSRRSKRPCGQPSGPCAEVDATARRIIIADADGDALFRHCTGHGIGMDRARGPCTSPSCNACSRLVIAQC